MKTRLLFPNFVGAVVLIGMMQGTGFAQMGTPADDGCTDVDEVIVCEGEAGDDTLECDNGGRVVIEDGEKRLYPGGKLLIPVGPRPNPSPNPNPNPSPGSNPTSVDGARGEEATGTIGIYVVEGANIKGGLTFVVILNDQANPNDSPGPSDQQNPHDSPGPKDGEKEFADDPQSDGWSEIEGTYLMLLDLGLTENEALSVLFGGEMTEDDERQPTKITKPVFGPLITTF